MKVIKLVFLINIFLMNNTFAHTNKTDIYIFFESVNKGIYLLNVDKEIYKNEIIFNDNKIKNIEKEASCINNYSDKKTCMKINIEGTSNIKIKEINVEVHAGTLFLNNKGIFFSDDAVLINGDFLVRDPY